MRGKRPEKRALEDEVRKTRKEESDPGQAGARKGPGGVREWKVIEVGGEKKTLYKGKGRVLPPEFASYAKGGY